MPKGRDEKMMRSFGRRLRAARITAGYENASELAVELGIQGPAYRKYERGESLPPLEVLDDIRRLLGCTLDWLLIGRAARPKIMTETGTAPPATEE